MSLTVQRLNLDNSWWISWNNTRLLLDPWITASEVDGFSWFNEQWHASAPVPADKIPAYDFVLVSQPYSDHCHAKSLKLLDRSAPVYAVPRACRRIRRELPTLNPLPIETNPQKIGELEVFRISPGRLIDPIYHMLLICCEKEALAYAPHGFSLSAKDLERISGYKIRLLLTSFLHFRLPFFLGGLVNPGTAGAFALMDQLKPERVINTHDEKKNGKGIVLKISEVIFPNMQALSVHDPRILPADHYYPINC
jgi:hypothetical protein